MLGLSISESTCHPPRRGFKASILLFILPGFHCEDEDILLYPVSQFGPAHQSQYQRRSSQSPQHLCTIKAQSEIKPGALYVIHPTKEEKVHTNDFYGGLYLHSDSMGGMSVITFKTWGSISPNIVQPGSTQLSFPRQSFHVADISVFRNLWLTG